ncbi:N-acetyl-l-glutamate kinase [Klebsormidium nitens]|uniref:acetylglutamate kinase n=1 Tax=Klebsormidium nitens TaxID=105231 RepID=A0A1Y1HNI3_KLENI|nr:N-acetyl-l-glutamate kinase [Klebsormidium nitens]|eukprot:GAQ79292.1 N-acetyl-l-glutamate kinase [Klebsormidium nitens]
MAASLALRPSCALAPPSSLASTPLAGAQSAAPSLLSKHARWTFPSLSRCSPPSSKPRFTPPQCTATAPVSADRLSRVDVLSEALPFIQRFQNKTVVIKYGGAAMKDESLKEGVIKDVVLLACVGLRPVLVHGGGPEINGWLQKLGIEPVFKQGLRVTDGPTMEVVEMVLTGKVNKSLVSLMNQAGGSAVGLCGKDAKLITARPEGGGEWGFVGEVKRVDVSILNTLVRDGHIPVIASVAADETGQSYNINADTAAGEIAASLGAEKLILMTDVPGLMMDFKDPSTIVHQGVKATHIIDGRLPHSLLLEVLTDEGRGTMITG